MSGLSWIKQAVFGISKPANSIITSPGTSTGELTLPDHASDILLRRPSDAGDEACFNEQHSPRPHEQPSDFRGWYKLKLGPENDLSDHQMHQRKNSAASASAAFLINGARRNSTVTGYEDTTALFSRSRRSSCPILSSELQDKSLS
jgi:hypothetical protein